MAVNSNEMQDLLNNLTNFQRDIDSIVESCAKELTARFLAKVIKRTPVGVYIRSQSRHGGTLRRGWSANNLTIAKSGNLYTFAVINPTHYASYVEYGHRTRGGTGWVQGRFMMTISAEEIQRSAQGILDKKIQKELEKYFGGQ